MQDSIWGEVPIIKIDCGTDVLCDICNEEMIDQKGGVLVGSYFFCPKCTKDISHPEEITETCPPEMTCKEWINKIRFRNGQL